jgi:integrase
LATITQRKTGWQVQVRRNGFKPLSKHFKTSADAKAWARTIEAETDRGVFVDRSHAERTTLADILQRYRNTVTPLKRGQKQERSRITVVLAHPVARQTLATLRAGDFVAYRDERLRQVSGTTVNKELNLFAHAIDTARREWSIHIENPVRFIKRPKNDRARDRRLDPGEEGRLIAAARLSGSAKIIEFALETAMRRGELVGMRWTHVDFTKRVSSLSCF